ncbi:MAG TPA: hypothetical protein DEG17_12415 [Cyanobacteria bacterium UBA11149]|nr:hypothetical protein [Cyanobacteria bacterium UBA11367]HBE59996.1 hypothetical protein [Cyanobacteria bacterium UBA11366]HBK63950.1 hypothetical protein [Cyanobacteria bacterium UBA11166]HBR75252.1 hypothetical protein [Cyanobacteria bacterium UBA11159]HBS70506.1 hypothetical protein [Cyanobacteria bacterium UBA11153]HBW89649.1 hypothetical protein [Cyanobacteria bacterium UBA11149]HCA96816.1 hypothetical protein [Cyanobacteria bacterium UBA9226]
MHYTTRRFWQCYSTLPENVQQTADQCYELLKADPSHPSLHFKKLSNKYWSVRVGLNHRVLGVEVEGGISWFWIGTHAEYDKLLGKL